MMIAPESVLVEWLTHILSLSDSALIRLLAPVLGNVLGLGIFVLGVLLSILTAVGIGMLCEKVQDCYRAHTESLKQVALLCGMLGVAWLLFAISQPEHSQAEQEPEVSPALVETEEPRIPAATSLPLLQRPVKRVPSVQDWEASQREQRAARRARERYQHYVNPREKDPALNFLKNS